jgi:hypothetical protein
MLKALQSLIYKKELSQEERKSIFVTKVYLHSMGLCFRLNYKNLATRVLLKAFLPSSLESLKELSFEIKTGQITLEQYLNGKGLKYSNFTALYKASVNIFENEEFFLNFKRQMYKFGYNVADLDSSRDVQLLLFRFLLENSNRIKIYGFL